MLEKNLTTNYQFGFPTDSSLMIINLSQWQYWWWFWFITYLILYWFIVIRIIRFRTLSFKPRIATTFRPHGKWGDLIVCIIPISWCFNILNHSNMLLRTMEWQTETSLFNVRIVGRQWFWIYKYDLKIISDIMTAPRNVGHNKWEILTPTSIKTANKYIKILQIRNETNWNIKYWTENANELPSTNIDDFLTTKPTNLNKYNKNIKLINDYKYTFNLNNKKIQSVVPLLHLTSFNKDNFDTINIQKYLLNLENLLVVINNFEFNVLNKNLNKIYLNNFNQNIISEYNEEFIRWFKFTQNNNLPVRIIKSNLTNLISDIKTKNFESTLKYTIKKPILTIRFNNTPNQYLMRNNNQNNFFIFQQNRIKKKKFLSSKVTTKIKYKSSVNFNQELFNLNNNIKKKTLKNNLLIQNNFFENLFNIKNKKSLSNNYLYDTNKSINTNFNLNTNFKLLKQYKLFSDNYNSMLSKRLLRTKKILVLPAHVNLTLITNSYDVTHSWFVPALAVKLDCVPGRSTHHILHIENVGLYYGQCAEICGRYHHHMPIRVCALPFDHFLIWWHSFGLPSILYTKTNKKYSSYYGFKKYYW